MARLYWCRVLEKEPGGGGGSGGGALALPAP